MADVAENPPSPTEAPTALFKKRNVKAKSNIRKRPATPPPAGSDSDDDSDYSSAEDETGHKIKRRRKAGVTVTQATARRPDLDSFQATKFTGDTSSTIEISNDATKQSNWYEEGANGALSAKQLLGTTRSTQDTQQQNQSSDGTYKGASNYQSYIQKNPNAPNRQVGPVKAPTNIRTVTVTDFAPDVCKDYKQTGFCGFGDSCKFLHAREDYKQGWQIDREWEIGSKNKTSKESADKPLDAEEKMLENIPFACIICKQSYKSPVVTKCGHYFCEKCALDRYKKNPTCAACGTGTSGVFNVAGNLKKLLQKKTEREKAKAENPEENADSKPAG